MFYLAYDYELTPYELMWNIMYILIHPCDICNICYLFLCYTVHWFCFWVGDYPLSVWLLNPSIYIFSPYVNAIGSLQSCILLCNSFRLCICTLGLNNASVELCSSFLSVNVILNRKC